MASGARPAHHAQAAVQGLGGGAKNANGRYQEWYRASGHPFFKKAGGGAYIYRVETRKSCTEMRCLGPTRVVNPHHAPKSSKTVTLASTMPALASTLGVSGTAVSKAATQPLGGSFDDEEEDDPLDWEPAWCISPVLDATEGVWAIVSCSETKLSIRTNEDWDVNLNVATGRPKVSIMRAMVHILRALNLRASDLNGLSDPYIICDIHGKEDLSFQTNVEQACLNPIWNMWREVDGIDVGDTVEFTCMDWDPTGDHDFLGSAMLHLRGGGWKGDLQLKCGKRGRAGCIRLEIIIPPEIPKPKAIVRKAVARPGDSAATLVTILSSGGLEAVGAAAVVENAALDENRRCELFMSGIVQPLVKMLSSHSQEGRQRASAALANMASLAPCRKAIVSAGAVPLLVNVMGDGSAGAKAEATRALEQLADREKVRCAIATAGAIKHLMTLLQSGDPTCIDRSAALISVLAESEVVADLISDMGGAPALVSQLSSDNLALQRSAAMALQTLSSSSAGKRAIYAAGAVEPLAELLRNGVPESRAEAASTIAALVGYPSAKRESEDSELNPRTQLVDDFMAAGVVESLVDLISNHGFLMRPALAALARLASVGSSLTHLIASGVLPMLLALQSTGYDAVTQGRAAEALQNMASTKESREAVEAAVPRGRSRELLIRILEASPEWHATISLTVKPNPPMVSPQSAGAGRKIVSATWKAEVKLRMEALEAKVESIRRTNPGFLVVGEHIPWPPPSSDNKDQKDPHTPASGGRMSRPQSAGARPQSAGALRRPQSAGSLRLDAPSRGAAPLAGTLRPRPQSAGARLRTAPPSASGQSTGPQRPSSAAAIVYTSAWPTGVWGRRISCDRSESVSNKPRLPPEQEALIAKMVPVCHHEINLKAAHIARTYTE
mmetsp:Transcript_44373/g.105080  ORF Transcript_44373/g.105080 Transcript_44373/m.105080 type:complete len:898 (+) Transcript_44373:110-2803(+)